MYSNLINFSCNKKKKKWSTIGRKEGSVWINRKYGPLITKLSSHPYPRSRDLAPPRSLPRFIFRSRLESGRAIVACPREIEIDTRTFAAGNKSILLFLLPSNEKQARDACVFFLLLFERETWSSRTFKRVQTHAHVGGGWRLIYYHVEEENCE